eukprot:11215180-Lingulodinium_polyedra.AAC.1
MVQFKEASRQTMMQCNEAVPTARDALLRIPSGPKQEVPCAWPGRFSRGKPLQARGHPKQG